MLEKNQCMKSFCQGTMHTILSFHSCYGNIFDVIGVGAWQTVCAPPVIQ